MTKYMNFSRYYRKAKEKNTTFRPLHHNDGIIKSKQSAVTTVSVTKMNIDSIYIRSFQLYDSKGTDYKMRNYDDTRIDSISINDDLGTDEEGDYIALVNLTWDVKNSAGTTEKMLQMYSDDLAASLAKEQPKVQEVAIFWNVPYLGENTSKWSYERKGEGMYQSDKIFGY